ncbi:amino acid permease-domain-containing protein [Dactylonectria macrodidyma]|uniref:Amino acid permease-domain-containing protein n=1 Tax=Dactylonectria macrodidyma TaxID=307937 RepID=A0A9P9IKN6_9HYPO|nr:amino acid permease-domain-containing protein [Dactylonectria macrodidyma]
MPQAPTFTRTAFLVGSTGSRTLSRGSPALTTARFVIICSIIWVFSTLLFEISAYIPLNGAAPDHYITRFLPKSFGFAMGWKNCTGTPIHNAVLISIFFVIIATLIYLPVGNTGEAEFAFSSLKLTMLIGIIIPSIVNAVGGGPSALFAAEIVAVCGGETNDPRETMTRAEKAFFVRLVVFCVLPILGVTLTCPSNASELTSGGAGADSSPFVIGIKNVGIHVLSSIVNIIILCSAWSAGNVYIYLASRSIYSLSTAGNAPNNFTKPNRWEVPYWVVTSYTVLTLLEYSNVTSSSGTVVNWLVNMINMAAFFSWILIAFAYLRFRAALELQSVDRSTLSYASVYGKSGTYLCIIFFTIVGLLNGFYVFLLSQWNVSDFLTAYR